IPHQTIVLHNRARIYATATTYRSAGINDRVSKYNATSPNFSKLANSCRRVNNRYNIQSANRQLPLQIFSNTIISDRNYHSVEFRSLCHYVSTAAAYLPRAVLSDGWPGIVKKDNLPPAAQTGSIGNNFTVATGTENR